MLKKQFQEKDVKRMRNIIKGKSGDATGSQLGYKKQQVERKEGDIWEEDGRKWTITNGIRQNVTKNKLAKKANAPLFCPECGGIMNKPLDKYFYSMRQTCSDCFYKFQTKLQIEGKWEDYKNEMNNKDIDYMKEELVQFFDDFVLETTSNESFITEGGDVEKWVGNVDDSKLKEGLDSALKKVG